MTEFVLKVCLVNMLGMCGKALWANETDTKGWFHKNQVP